MNSISWQATLTTENAAVEKEGSLFLKFSVPRRLITVIGIYYYTSKERRVSRTYTVK